MSKIERFIREWLLLIVNMGQEEVNLFLKRNKGSWFSSRQIAARLKISIGSVTTSLKRLRQTKQVKSKLEYEKKIKRKIYKYSYKR